jgi:hypothetical protein
LDCLGLDGFTISEEGGLEELEEFFESLATFSASSALALRSLATCLVSSATYFSKAVIRWSRCFN